VRWLSIGPAKQHLSERGESRMIEVGDARPSHEVEDCGIDVEALEGAFGYAAHVEYAVDPPVDVVHELAASAIRVEKRNVASVRIKSDSIGAITGVRQDYSFWDATLARTPIGHVRATQRW